MANLLARIQNFTARTKWLGDFLGNRFAATTYLLKARSDRMAIKVDPIVKTTEVEK